MRVDIEECELQDDLVLYNGEPFSGILFSLYDDGNLRDECAFAEGLPHGTSREWYRSGKLLKKWNCVNGRAEGLLTKYYEEGQKEIQEWREFGVVVTKKIWNTTGELVESWVLDANSKMAKYVEESRGLN